MARLTLPPWLQKLLAALAGAAIYIRGRYDELKRQKAAAAEAEKTVEQIRGDAAAADDDELNRRFDRW